MSMEEINQIELFEKLRRREIKQKKVAKLLNITIRQVQRKLHQYKLQGAKSLVHKGRGKTSNRKIDQKKLDWAIDEIRKKYHDFSPTLAHEYLFEDCEPEFSIEKLRQEMIRERIWTPQKKMVVQVHQLRERRACFGELVQLDGSPHNWFEDRGEYCNLNVMIDDATSKVMMWFSKTETAQDYFSLVERYFQKVGIPLALYVDKHSIFRINTPTNLDLKKPNKNNQFEGLTQFGRACKELNIELIYANSAQAKGRVERVNKTLQNRLVKALRLANINTIEEGNIFLKEFEKQFNKRFAQKPHSEVNMHKKLPKNINLTKILCIKEQRILSKNLTLQYNNIIYQIKTKRSAFTLRKTVATVCERYDGSITLLDNKDRLLDYTTIKKLPNTRETSSKQLNKLVDDILIKQKRNPWESDQSELEQPNLFFKPTGAV